MKILFIEDDQHTSAFLSETLSAHHYAVDAIADGSVGLELAIQWSYDLILLDVLIPTVNGIEVCRRLRAQGCQTPILMLTVKDSNEDIIAGLDAGADDYVAKSCEPSQLLARVRALMRRGGQVTSSPMFTWGLLCLDPAAARVTYNQQEIALRPKEYSLLELFLRHPQRLLNRSTIIDHLWPMEETPVEGSVTNLIKDLRRRLKAAGMATDLIETVYGVGYRLKAAPAPGGEGPGPGESPNPVGSVAATAISPPPLSLGWPVREQRGKIAIQHIAERFQISLEQRIEALEAVERSLQANNFSVQQQIAARTEVHKLAGALGTFGYIKASAIAQALEGVLDKGSPETQLASQFSRLLEELRQELTQPLTPPMAAASLVTH